MASRWHCSPRSPFAGRWRDKCNNREETLPSEGNSLMKKGEREKKVIETKVKQESGCRISKVSH